MKDALAETASWSDEGCGVELPPLPPRPKVIEPQPPTRSGDKRPAHACHFGDGLSPTAKHEVEVQETAQEVVSVLQRKELDVSADKAKAWSAGDRVAIQVNGRAIQNQSEV